jgi:hypothetical protein
MRTTVDLPDSLFERAKRTAAKRGITLRRLVEDAVRRYVTEPKPDAFQLEDVSFKGTGLAPELDWSEWGRIRDLAYEGRGG